MEASIKTHEPGGFRPFTLIIKVKTSGDLHELWHRFNLCHSELRRLAESSGTRIPYPTSSCEGDEDIWDILNKEVSR